MATYNHLWLWWLLQYSLWWLLQYGLSSRENNPSTPQSSQSSLVKTE
jgi:hypothetical protein